MRVLIRFNTPEKRLRVVTASSVDEAEKIILKEFPKCEIYAADPIENGNDNFTDTRSSLNFAK